VAKPFASQTMDVFLLCGQSNMAGRAPLPTGNGHHTSDTLTDPDLRTVINGHEILSFGPNNEWIPAHDPLHYDKPAKCGIGPGLSFAKLIAELDVVDTNRQIGLIPCAVGGTSIQQWLPPKNTFDPKTEHKSQNPQNSQNPQTSSSEHLFNRTVAITKLALQTAPSVSTPTASPAPSKDLKNGSKHSSDPPDITLKAILWHQGESDCASQSAAESYLENALSLFEQLRSALGNDNIPILCGGLGGFLGQNPNGEFAFFALINTALMTLPQRLHNAAFVSGVDLAHKGDWLHLDAESAVKLGHRFAEKYAKLSGAVSEEELSRYMKLMRFRDMLRAKGKRMSRKAIARTRGVSVGTWLAGAVCTAVAIYVYKTYYADAEKGKGSGDKK